MNAPTPERLQRSCAVAEGIAQACARIAPTWPLDRLVAVNPWWGWTDTAIDDAAARLATLNGARLTAPRPMVRSMLEAGRIDRTHLQAAIERSGSEIALAELLAALQAPDEPAAARLPIVTTLRDAAEPQRWQRWSELVTHQVSQHCAAWFDEGQAGWQMDRSGGLFASWRRQLQADRGIEWHRGRGWLRSQLAATAADPAEAVSKALVALRMPQPAWPAYLSALLLDINGWAAWCAGRRWQARLADGDDDTLVQLLAIRLCWERLLFDDARPGIVDPAWTQAWEHADDAVAAQARAQQLDWLLQSALEIAYQQPLCEALASTPARNETAAVQVQAVFCIDVRSEPMRRALEATGDGLQTRGFAGFFGLPIAYSPLGTTLGRPQLPALLAPTLDVVEEAEPPVEGRHLAMLRRQRLGWSQRWAQLRTAATSGFGFVEACGLGYAAKLASDSLRPVSAAPRWEDSGLPANSRVRPRLALAEADPAAAAALVRDVLVAMGLTEGFAPLVMLAGHGSRTTNNPQAAGLDCGACGGQTGEVNARVLAALLNAAPVRAELARHGITIPGATHFVPALHDTTTDDVRLFDTDDVPPALRPVLARLRGRLDAAAQLARQWRAPALGLQSLAEAPGALAAAVRSRGSDWAEVRPEWGLADNAAFVVAPRIRTRSLDLGGRAFLHDYDWFDDPDGRTLTLIMTAPMIVTHWINMQYHASTVDPQRQGSGDKVLHNVVGARIGVFEGNGGDLRIGLPLQSVHDGQGWRHTPLRLSVFIESPRAAIDAVLAAHPAVRQLVDGGWLHLFRIDPHAPLVEQRRTGRWALAASGPVAT